MVDSLINACHLGAALNWRLVREIEQRMRETEIAILRERQMRLQIEQIKKEDEQIENQIENL